MPFPFHTLACIPTSVGSFPVCIVGGGCVGDGRWLSLPHKQRLRCNERWLDLARSGRCRPFLPLPRLPLTPFSLLFPYLHFYQSHFLFASLYGAALVLGCRLGPALRGLGCRDPDPSHARRSTGSSGTVSDGRSLRPPPLPI
ncbi:hypothetical protein EXIGLDRAFT_137462 [Exidia glandulosa HHB12029]|uniref:Uncharacterized protein n=1 Tax=Exidia glandulosa HHB12029 TaxID=1314781 RepID=A0A165G0S8_EXIGL|nr:hypothetical protein EXIGLDRAFT_137462 [Exidia glandulosa HHB12029]